MSTAFRPSSHSTAELSNLAHKTRADHVGREQELALHVAVVGERLDILGVVNIDFEDDARTRKLLSHLRDNRNKQIYFIGIVLCVV